MSGIKGTNAVLLPGFAHRPLPLTPEAKVTFRAKRRGAKKPRIMEFVTSEAKRFAANDRKLTSPRNFERRCRD
jgi:hypothetical protein